MSRRAAPWLHLAAVAGGALLPLLPALLTGRTLVWRDGAQLYAPLRPAIVAALRDLRLPLWNPWEGAGQPLFAQGIHAVLHPVSVLLAPFTASLDALLVALVVLAGLGTSAAARTLGASRPAAAAAAFAYALSGFVLAMTANLPFLAGAASAPWMVAGLRLAATARAGWIAAALGTAATALSGDPGFLAAALLAGLALALEGGRARGGARALLGAALGLALAGIQLVPSWAWLQETARGAGALPASDLRTWALAPWRLLELVAPGLVAGIPRAYAAPVFVAVDGAGRGFPFAASLFVGAPALLLATLGARVSRPARVALGLAALFLWLALGHRAGAQQLLAGVPVFGALRYWEKMVGPLTLCLALGAGLGVDAASGALRLAARRAAAAGAGVAVILAALAPLLAGAMAGAAGPAVAALAGTQLRIGLAHAAVGLAVAAAAGWLVRGAALPPALAAVLLAQSAAASPFALHAGDPAVLRIAPPALAAPDPGPRLVSPLGFDFASSPGPLDAIDLLQAWEARTARPATNAAAGVDSIVAYTGVASLRYETLLASGQAFWPMIRRYATTHVLARPVATAAEAAAMAEATRGGVPVSLERDPGLQAWAIPHRPWATFAPAARTAPGLAAAALALGEELEAGRATVVVETEGTVAVAPGRVLAVRRGVEEIEIAAESAADALLVVNDAFAPGWRATIDGRAVELFPADVLVRAVRWPAGSHRLVMRYEAPGLAAGAALSAAAALVLVAGAGAVLAAARRSRRRRPEREPATVR